MTGQHAPAELLGALSTLLTVVRSVRLDLATDDVDDVRTQRDAVRNQLADYLVPRLVQMEAPLLTVVGGSTGAGKSTLVNSIVGETVTESGVLRPTTRSPVLVHHPDDEAWFLADRILPGLPRTEDLGNTTYALRLKASTRLPRGLAILDAPDVDSIDRGNREVAAHLLAASDLWLFVTSAARYSDQIPWDYLRQAAERGTSVAVVLDRTSPAGITEVRGHLARMMTSRGLSDSPLFTVPEAAVGPEGLLPDEAVESLRGWLYDLAGDDRARELVIMQTLDGTVRQNVQASFAVADALDTQIAAAGQLIDIVEDAFGAAIARAIGECKDASLLSGEVVARWQEFVGTGEILRSVEEKVGRIRTRLVDGVTGKRTKTEDVARAIEQAMAMMLIDHAESASARVAVGWAEHGPGRSILEVERGLDRASRDMRVRAERVARDWQQQVLETVRVQTTDKRLTARFMALGVGGLGTAVMVAALAASTADAEARTADIARRLLEDVFGAQVAVQLVDDVVADLAGRIDEALVLEAARYLDLLPMPDALRASQDALRAAARRSEYARHVGFLDEETR
ncbi:GTPase [Aeromicrobium marinum]|uniref:GTPase n=1 Tax=Aeromicrobium marinum TaxID=219314 RepID=UPI00058E3512|nr:GTPase [Aeromicrobium marinum]